MGFAENPMNYFLHTEAFTVVEILSGSVISPPESVGAVQPVSKSTKLILLRKRWEPEPWQPSAQISVGRKMAGDGTQTHTQINMCVCVCMCVLPPSP